MSTSMSTVTQPVTDQGVLAHDTVTLCIATYRRPDRLAALLQDLDAAKPPPGGTRGRRQ